MSNHIGDENTDYLNRSNHIDSGYLTFISPCSNSTPSRLSPSSVILNQIDSPISEYDIQSPINKKFLSNIDYENYISTRKHFDILTQLNHRNAYHLIDKILINLSNNDLYHCSYICRIWYFILKDYLKRKQIKNVKRNLFNINNKILNKHNIKLTTKPMQTITNLLDIKSTNIPLIVETKINDENILPKTPLQNLSSEKNNIHLTASTMTFRYGYLKYLHGPTITKRCPICAFVSIVDVNDQHG